MTMPVLPPISSRPDPVSSGSYKVAISRGHRIGRVSSEWFSRPDDEHHPSLLFSTGKKPSLLLAPRPCPQFTAAPPAARQ